MNGSGQDMVYTFLQRNAPRAYAPGAMALKMRVYTPVLIGAMERAAARLVAKGLVNRVLIGDGAGGVVARYYFDNGVKYGAF